MTRKLDPTLALFGKAIRSPEAASPLIAVAFALILFLTGFTAEDTRVNGISWHVLDLLPGATAMIVFVIAWLVLRRDPARQAKYAIWIWLLAGVLGEIAQPTFVFLVTGSLPLDFAGLIPVGLVQFPLNIAGIGVVLSAWLMQRKQLVALGSQRARLAQAEARLSGAIAGTQAELDSLVSAQLVETLNALEKSLDSDAEVAEQSRVLRTTIDSVVRPLSHQLAAGSAVSGSSVSDRSLGASVDVSLTKRAKLNRRLPLSEQLSPTVFAIAGILIIAPTIGLMSTWLGFVLAVAVYVTVAVVQRIAIRLFGTRPINNVLIAIGSLCASAVVTLGVMLLATAPELAPAKLALLVGVLIITALTGILVVLSAQRQHAIAEDAANLVKLDAIVMRLTHESWLLHRRYARLVHGTIQSRLLTAAMRLRAESASPIEARENARRDLSEAIAALNKVDVEFNESFETQLRNLRAAWDGVCEIRLTVKADTLAAIEADAIARDCVSEVLSEAVANAVKHASATAVDARLECDGAVVTLTVVNAIGAGAMSHSTDADNPGDVHAADGYGSAIISEATTHWSREITDDEVVVRASFVVGQK